MCVCDGPWVEVIVLAFSAATLRCPLPDREGERERGGEIERFRRSRRRRLNNPLPIRPPEVEWGRGEQKPIRFLQRADMRSGMNGGMPGVTVAGERRALPAWSFRGAFAELRAVIFAPGRGDFQAALDLVIG